MMSLTTCDAVSVEICIGHGGGKRPGRFHQQRSSLKRTRVWLTAQQRRCQPERDVLLRWSTQLPQTYATCLEPSHQSHKCPALMKWESSKIYFDLIAVGSFFCNVKHSFLDLNRPDPTRTLQPTVYGAKCRELTEKFHLLPCPVVATVVIHGVKNCSFVLPT